MTHTTFDPADVIADGNYSYWSPTWPGGFEMIYAPGRLRQRRVRAGRLRLLDRRRPRHWALTLDERAARPPHPPQQQRQSPQVDLELIPGYSYGYGVFIEPLGELTSAARRQTSGAGRLPDLGARASLRGGGLATTFTALSNAATHRRLPSVAGTDSAPPRTPRTGDVAPLRGPLDFTTSTVIRSRRDHARGGDARRCSCGIRIWLDGVLHVEHSGTGASLPTSTRTVSSTSELEFHRSAAHPEPRPAGTGPGGRARRKPSPRPAGGSLGTVATAAAQDANTTASTGQRHRRPRPFPCPFPFASRMC